MEEEETEEDEEEKQNWNTIVYFIDISTSAGMLQR